MKTSAAAACGEKARVLYIACSSFSGSTLLSFLLNSHPKIVTLGHTTGWHFDDDETFLCSCGEPIQSCAFYQSMSRAFRDFGLVGRTMMEEIPMSQPQHAVRRDREIAIALFRSAIPFEAGDPPATRAQ